MPAPPKDGGKAAKLKPGLRAPAFTLPRDGGGNISLSDFKGRKLVLYFYPKADTEGCTREARDFSALAKVSNHSANSAKPSSRAVFAMPGYI